MEVQIVNFVFAVMAICLLWALILTLKIKKTLDK